MLISRSALAALAVLGAVAAFAVSRGDAETPTLKDAASFASISDANERSVALFKEAGKVIQHPRCVNCHPVGESPRQGEDLHIHQPHVVRGDGGMGAVGMRCTTCHGAANYDVAKVPGNPAWHLAPPEMGWYGKSLGDICTQIKDPARNGGKDLQALLKHMAEDELVGWGWNPGVGRTPAPGNQKQFGELIKAWIEAGAVCPKT